MDAIRQATPFGKYVLLERVSVGGMAEVFKAKAFGVEGFEKILAIKCILPSMADDADFIEMFIDEAKICGQLNHANICQIFELGRVAESHFIAMEFVWGKDVLQMQNRFRKLRQKMKPEMAAYIVSKICEGLDYAHKKKDAQGRPLGIIHRDISPQNILVSYEGELKVIDFGIAKAASRSSKTQAGVLKGKFGYMSPEQVRGLPLDRRSDIFAIGTILYELLTAERLFYGESDFETLEKVRNVDVPPPTTVNPSIPKQLERIIMRALSKDVEGRYQWAAEMAEDLNAFLVSTDPVFSAANLSQWMREQFAVEMRRERLVLDEQQKVTRDVLLSAPPGRPKQKSRPTGNAIPLRAPEPELADDDDDDFNEKTTVSLPGFDSSPATAAPLPDQSTRILDGQLPGVAPMPPSSPTRSQSELAAQSTVVFGDPSAPAVQMPPPRGTPLDSTPFASPVSIDPSLYPQPDRSFTPHYGQLNPPEMALPPPPLRSTLWKDILIGVGVAAAVVVGVLGVRSYLSGRGVATLVVMTPTGGGELVLDGVARGHLMPATPLTLKNVTVGGHTVVVRGDTGEFQQNITLVAGDVNVVTATFASAALETGKLKLEIEMPTATGAFEPASADVYVDGAQLSSDATRTLISLRAGAQHEVRITKPGFAEKHFNFELRAGETVVRPVRLEVDSPRLAITSEPSGAEVQVNGHRAGTTPATFSELEWGKAARVSVRLSGYLTVQRTIVMDRTGPSTIDVKLIAGKDPKDPNDETAALAPKPDTRSDVKPEPKPDRGKKEPVADKSDAKAGKGSPKKDASPKGALPSDGLATVSFNTDKDKGPSTETGFLVANTQPWAKVVIDGKDTGKTTPIAPRSKIALKPGKHNVTFVAGGKKYSYDVVVKAGEDLYLIKQLSDAP
ncbi:MAG: protein kinase [Polyangia bacterium]